MFNVIVFLKFPAKVTKDGEIIVVNADNIPKKLWYLCKL